MTLQRLLIALGHAGAIASLATITFWLYVGLATGDWTVNFNVVGEGHLEAFVATFALFGLGLGWGRAWT